MQPFQRKHVFFPGEKLPHGDFIKVDLLRSPGAQLRMFDVVLIRLDGRRVRGTFSMFRWMKLLKGVRKRYPRAVVTSNKSKLTVTIRRWAFGPIVAHAVPVGPSPGRGPDPTSSPNPTQDSA